MSKQQKAEYLVTKFLDSLNKSTNYQIVAFEHLDTIFSTYSDERDFEKYKNDSLKVDSIQRHFKHKITGWSLYVIYQGRNSVGVLGKHVYVCGIDKELSKCFGGNEIVN